MNREELCLSTFQNMYSGTSRHVNGQHWQSVDSSSSPSDSSLKEQNTGHWNLYKLEIRVITIVDCNLNDNLAKIKQKNSQLTA